MVKSVGSLGKGSILDSSIKLQLPEYFNIGANCNIGENSILYAWDNYLGQVLHPSLTIGNNVNITRNLTLYCTNKITIEDDVLIASNVLITDENHGKNPTIPNYMYQPLEIKEVYIGRGCWIGEQCCILPGANIGEKSIIGANSVVTSDIPSYTIAVGNPAKVIKKYDFQKNAWVKLN